MARELDQVNCFFEGFSVRWGECSIRDFDTESFREMAGKMLSIGSFNSSKGIKLSVLACFVATVHLASQIAGLVCSLVTRSIYAFRHHQCLIDC